MTWPAMLLDFAWFWLRVFGVTAIFIAFAVWLNWRRLCKPKPPDDFV